MNRNSKSFGSRTKHGSSGTRFEHSEFRVSVSKVNILGEGGVVIARRLTKLEIARARISRGRFLQTNPPFGKGGGGGFKGRGGGGGGGFGRNRGKGKW